MLLKVKKIRKMKKACFKFIKNEKYQILWKFAECRHKNCIKKIIFYIQKLIKKRISA